MMLMTKFGKFKLRLIATINLSALLTIFNLASATSNYWIKYVDIDPNAVNGGVLPHIAGMWRSCPVGEQTTANCQWKNGILTHSHSAWSIFVRLLVALGTVGNVAAVSCLCFALYFKLNKRSKCAIKLMEWANGILIGAFIGIMIGFCVFLSTKCNYSMWLHVASLCLVAASSNLATRTFARLYYINTRGFGKSSSRAAGVEAGCCTADEKIALAQVDKETNTNGGGTVVCCDEPQMSPVECNKVSEKHGSNEALLPAAAQQTTTISPQPDAADTTPAVPATTTTTSD